jgi:hypothetical protein
VAVEQQVDATIRALGAVAPCAVLVGCAGNGDGLDENGRPVGEGPPGDDDFTTIQDTIFTPRCTVCHAGAQAPLGLRLDAGSSYAMLVDGRASRRPNYCAWRPATPTTATWCTKSRERRRSAA